MLARISAFYRRDDLAETWPSPREEAALRLALIEAARAENDPAEDGGARTARTHRRRTAEGTVALGPAPG